MSPSRLTVASIYSYWRMFAEDGHIEELNVLERSRAFGLKILDANLQQVKVVIKALPSNAITAFISPSPYAIIHLPGEDRILQKVYL